MLSENAFKEMPTLADKSSDFGFSSGIQVYFWTQRPILLWAAEPLRPLRGFGKTPTVDVLATAPRLRTFQP